MPFPNLFKEIFFLAPDGSQEFPVFPSTSLLGQMRDAIAAGLDPKIQLESRPIVRVNGSIRKVINRLFRTYTFNNQRYTLVTNPHERDPNKEFFVKFYIMAPLIDAQEASQITFASLLERPLWMANFQFHEFLSKHFSSLSLDLNLKTAKKILKNWVSPSEIYSSALPPELFTLSNFTHLLESGVDIALSKWKEAISEHHFDSSDAKNPKHRLHSSVFWHEPTQSESVITLKVFGDVVPFSFEIHDLKPLPKSHTLLTLGDVTSQFRGEGPWILHRVLRDTFGDDYGLTFSLSTRIYNALTKALEENPTGLLG